MSNNSAESSHKPNFGENQGVWEYYDKDNNLLGYTVRKKTKTGKRFEPWSFQNNEWVMKWYESNAKPIYNTPLLVQYPDKPVLIVEGEKAADAASRLLPNYVCVSWMGGSGSAGKADLSLFVGRKVCLWPDNDVAGYKAMDKLEGRLKGIASQIGIINPELFGFPEKWDLGDFDEKQGIIDWEMILLALENVWNKKSQKEFELIDPKTFPYLGLTGKIINTYENVGHLLDFYKINVRFNELRREIEADIPHKNFTKSNKAKLLLAEVTSLCNKNGVPRIDLPSWLIMLADNNAYNPVCEYINSKPWDGVCRKQEFFNTIEADNNKHRDFIMERWMRGAVASGTSKIGMAHSGVLTLLGKTGNGKSSWLKKLVPAELNLLLADFVFNPHNKDDNITATKFWITELAEASGTIKLSNSDALKAFITRAIDVFRSPYDRVDTESPRKTCLVASVNDPWFLKDDTGNRRWWVIETKEADYEHKLDMQQIWAQFKNEYEQGALYYLTKEEINIINEINEMYRPSTSIYEAIVDRFCWDEPYRNLRIAANQVLYECGYQDLKGNSALTKEANRVLQQLTGEKSIKYGGLYKYKLPRLNPHYRQIT